MAQVNGILSDQEINRRAMEELEKMRRITEAKQPVIPGVTIGGSGFGIAANGAGRAPEGQKIAELSAAARAPEATTRASGVYGAEAPGAGRFGRKQPVENPEIPESRKTKPNKRENEFMLNLMILRNTLHRNAPECRERARLAGRYVWRDIRLITRMVDKIQDALLRTMPKSRDDYYSAYAMHGHYELHIDGPIRTARHLLVTDIHLATIAEAAMKNECIMCTRDGSEIGKCPLREALLESAVPTAIDDGDSMFRKCEYRDAAGQLVQGKDVTV